MDPTIASAIIRTADGESINIAEFCRTHQISRTTFYKYKTQFTDEGANGFIRRSTVPHTSPTRTPAAVCEAVVRARKELDDAGLDYGPQSISWHLEALGFDPAPSRSTVYRILVDRGQIVAQPRKRPKSRRRFEYADPGGLWQIDGMETYLSTGETVCVLQILDDHSRLDVGCFAAGSENGADVWKALEQAFAGYGFPVRVLFDNGLAFSAKHRGGTSPLERTLANLGVHTITSSVCHPQTCGKNERAHQTLRKWLRKHPTPDTLEELQEMLEEYRQVYNNRRHQSLGGRTPQQCYDEKPTVSAVSEPIIRSGRTDRNISHTGIVQFDGHSISLGRAWGDRPAVVLWRGDDVTVMVGNVIARELTLDRSVKFQSLTNVSTKS